MHPSRFTRSVLCALLHLPFLLHLPLVASHLTTVCTSTAPSTCANQQVVFYLGTYHDVPSGGSAPGEVGITTPTGTTTWFSFSSTCAVNGHQNNPPTSCPVNQIMSGCASAVTPSDADVTC